jgi:small conductance mechanosensitive channel
MNNLLFILLQTTTVTPERIQQKRDSVRAGARMMIEHAKSDPEEFWQLVLDTMIQFGLKVLAALLIYIIGIWLIGWLKRVMKRMFERRKVEPTLASFISSFTSITLTVLLVVIAISTLGVNTTSLAALLAAGGMAIGMALSGTVQNFAGGLMLLAFKPFKAGDFIEAQGQMGKVIEVNITATKILTTDNRVVILPNGALSNGTINNFTGRPLRRVEWLVSVSYGVEAAACKKAILTIVNSEPRVLQDTTNMDELYKELNISKFQLSTVNYRMESIPAPFVALKSLNENDITFVVRAWVRSEDYWGVYFELLERFYTELPPQGFTFAYPHVDVTMLPAEASNG